MQAVHNATSRALLKIKGLSDTKVDRIKDAIKKCMACTPCTRLHNLSLLTPSQPNHGGFMTGSEILEMRKRCFRLSTGSKNWDGILNGGLQSMSINEVYGEFRCGKTQLAHTLCVMAQLPLDRGGAEGRVAYIGSSFASVLSSVYADSPLQILRVPSVRSASQTSPSALALTRTWRTTTLPWHVQAIRRTKRSFSRTCPRTSLPDNFACLSSTAFVLCFVWTTTAELNSTSVNMPSGSIWTGSSTW